MLKFRKNRINEKKIGSMARFLTAILVILSYEAGILGYYRISDLLLVSGLFLLNAQLLQFVFGEKNIELLTQITGLYFLWGLLVTAALIYQGNSLFTQKASAFVIVSSFLGLFLCLYGLRRWDFQIRKQTLVWMQEHWYLLLACGIFTLFSASEIISISQWDATFYINSMDVFIKDYDLTFKRMLSSNLGEHLSAGYSLIAGAWHMLIFTGNIGIKLCNIVMGWIAFNGIDCMLATMKVKQRQRAFTVLLFALSPMVLGIIGAVSVDYALMVYGVVFVAAYIGEKKIIMLAAAILFLFTKETSIVIYIFFWSGIFLFRIFEKDFSADVKWKDMASVFSRGEWLAMGVPIVLFLVIFLTYMMENIGWPGTLIASRDNLHVMAGIVFFLLFAAVLLLYLWIVLFHKVKRAVADRKGAWFWKGLTVALPFVLGFITVAILLFKVPVVRERFVIHDVKEFNRIAVSKQHVITILKQAYILNFSWLLVFLLAVGFFMGRERWKRVSGRRKETVIAVIFADCGFVLFTMIYVTYQNPRYLQLHYAFLILLLGCVWEDIWDLTKKRMAICSCASFIVLILLMTIETYCYIDPITIQSFYTRDIGNGILCGGDTKKLGLISSCYSDRVMNNRVYSYYLKDIEKFLKDIEYDGSQTILFPDYGKWGTLGRRELDTIDRELKWIVPYEGSFQDSVGFIKKFDDIEKYMGQDREVYYISMGVFYTKRDQLVEEWCSEEQKKSYTTGTWKITAYHLESKK